MESQNQTAMTQNHQSAMKCASLVKEGIALLNEVTPATNKDLEHACKLGGTLEQLSAELQVLLTRAERKLQRRKFRDQMKGKTQL
jgi:hypothetical protein